MVVAIAALSLLVILHECGHYLVARWCQIRIERFRLGFGPVLLERASRKTATRFALALIPFGASAKIRGMNVAEDSAPEDPHAYRNRPVWQRLVTVLAGPATNYLLASMLAMVLYTCHGIDVPHWYGVDDVMQGYDAYGKLEHGDRILAVDHRPLYIDSGPSLIERVLASGGAPITLTIERDGQAREVLITPRQDQTGNETAWRLGVKPLAENLAIELGTFDATRRALAYPFVLTATIVKAQYRILLGSEKADPGGPVRMTMEFAHSLSSGWVATLKLMMLLNVYLGMLYLVPIPGLDGIHLVSLAYQIATRRRAKRTKTPLV